MSPPDRRKVLPWPAERVAAVASAWPDRYQAITAVAAGLGLRQGECFGLAVDDYYASALPEDGVNIRAVAEYLGHNDPGFTLRVYAHLMPSSAARARTAVDRALGGAPVAGPRALDVPSVGG